MLKQDQFKNILQSIVIIFMTNISMFVLAWWTGSERSILNLDYFLPLFLLVFGQRFLGVIFFIGCAFFDFLGIFAQVFPFVRIADFFYLLKFSFISSTVYKIYGLSLLLFLFIEIYVILKVLKKEHGKSLLIVFNILVLFYTYQIYWGSDRKVSFWKPEDKGVVASQLINYIDYKNRGFIKTYDVQGDAFQKGGANGASEDLFVQKQTYDKILLVVNESWGVPNQRMAQQGVLDSIITNPHVKDLKQGELNFEGFTVGGELRELCKKSVIHFNLKNQMTGFEKCLANQYRNAGYQTVAVHGALGLMYDRQYWYPRAGFNKMLFRDQGLNLPYSQCYSFPGNCDSDIAEKITQEFQKNKHLFLYWLTLNTHAVYDVRDLKYDLFDCKKYGIQDNTASCRNLKLQTQYFHTLSEMIKQPAFKGSYIIVVGDHQPPILREEKNIFKHGKIAYIKFRVG